MKINTFYWGYVDIPGHSTISVIVLATQSIQYIPLLSLRRDVGSDSSKEGERD